MMRRLRDELDSTDAILSGAAKLLDAAQPPAPTDAMRRRVLASMVRDRRPLTARRRTIARPAAFAAVLLATTVAAASFEAGWIARAYQVVLQRTWSSRRPEMLGGTDKRRLASAQPVKVGQESARAGADQKLALPNEPEIIVPPASALVPAPVADVAIRAPVKPGHRARAAGAGAKTSPAPVVLADTADGATVVLSAMGALRRERDPARAGQMLEEYLRTYPRGALREEAMALAVEAAVARNDVSEAHRLALRYERAFPGGRFRSLISSAR